MGKTLFIPCWAALLALTGWSSLPAIAELRVAEFSVDVRQRVDAFSFTHPYEDKNQEGPGLPGYEPTGRSELAWANLTSTFTEATLGVELPAGRVLRLQGGKGDFQEGVARDLDYGTSGNLWSHTVSDASAGGILSGSVTLSLEDDARTYWGLSYTSWDLRLEGGRSLVSGMSEQALARNTSTYNARRLDLLLGTGFDLPLGDRVTFRVDAMSGAGWVHSEARWSLRGLAFTQDGFAISADVRAGLGIDLSEASRVVLSASGGGAFVPLAAGVDTWENGRTQAGSGISILASHWALGARTEIRF